MVGVVGADFSQAPDWSNSRSTVSHTVWSLFCVFYADCCAV